MKKILLSLFLGMFFSISRAQENTPVTFGQVTDTLVKQRFIDRYENVLMTKVPTRQMFKLGYMASTYRGTGFHFGYEYKVLPAVSLEVGVFAQTSYFNTGRINLDAAGTVMWAHAQARWYYSMNKRMARGLSANNFSGAYLAVSYDRTFYTVGRAYELNNAMQRGGLLFGFQSRFLNSGHVDLALGLFNREVLGSIYKSYTHGFFDPKDFVLATQSTIGIALGDWKRSAKVPACDVLLCDEHIHDHWKLRLPDVAIGLRTLNANTSLAYERGLGKSPFSVDVNINGSILRRNFPDIRQSQSYLGGGVQLRYYFLQKHQIQQGKAGDNFSGPYAGIGVNYLAQRLSSNNAIDGTRVVRYQHASAALHLGYQQRLFRRLYVDASVYYAQNARLPRLDDAYGRVHSRAAIGFTF